jgi:alkylation response protein AidB-like acyl-CoA dehydrogenase
MRQPYPPVAIATPALKGGDHIAEVTSIAQLDGLLSQVTLDLAATAHHYDRSGEFPGANIDYLHAKGLVGLTVPVNLGGGGAELDVVRRVISAVAQGEPSTALILVMQYLQHFLMHRDVRWPEHLRNELGLEASESGALINALRVEPDLGTPARGGLPATVARRTDEGWRLTGTKIYSTGSVGLTWYLVWARSDDETPLVGGYLVHRDTPGIEIIKTWDHLGMRATCSHEIRFSDVLIPLDHAVTVSPLGEANGAVNGLELLWVSVMISSLYDGVARASRDWIVEFLTTRAPSNLGAPLASLPRFQEVLGRIETLLFSNRTLLDSAVKADADEQQHAAQIKYLVCRNAIEAVSLAVEASGNHGLSRNNPLERHLRDVLCSRIHTPQDDAVLRQSGTKAFSEYASNAQGR